MKLVVDKESLVSVADAIREKGGTAESLEFPKGFVDAVGAIESGGGGTEELENLIDQSGVLDSTDGTATEKVEALIKRAEDEKRWYQMTKENSYFGGNTFRNYSGTVLPRADFSVTISLNYFASSATRLERIDFYIDCKKCQSFQGAFGATPALKYMKGINTSACVNANGMFQNSGIAEIEMPFDFSKNGNFTNTFTCAYLREIRFVAETIKVSIAFTSIYLSAESVQSIIDGLAYVTTSQNLTLKSSVIVTDNQKQVIKAKGWTLIMQ